MRTIITHRPRVPVPAQQSPPRALPTPGAHWFLPSNFELTRLYDNRTAIGGFQNDFYWSSSEWDIYADAWYFVDNGFPGPHDKFMDYYVRAVRAF